MAKRIYIEYKKKADKVIDRAKNLGKDRPGNTVTLEFPLMDDVLLEVTSDFTSMLSAIPMVQDLVNVQTAIQGSTGATSLGAEDFKNKLAIERWERTNPIKFNINLLLYTKEDAKQDVYDPMMDLISLTILSKDVNNPGRYIVPGLNLSNWDQATKAGRDKGLAGLSENSKLISVEIPGIIYLPLAMVRRVVPTVSKEETDSGYPLWASLNVEIVDLYPATSDILRATSSAFAKKDEISALKTSLGQTANVSG